MKWTRVRVRLLLPLLIEMVSREKQAMVRFDSMVFNTQTEVYTTSDLFAELEHNQVDQNTNIALSKSDEQEIISISNLVVDNRLMDRHVSTTSPNKQSSTRDASTQQPTFSIWISKDHLTKLSLQVDSFIYIASLPANQFNHVYSMIIHSPQLISVLNNSNNSNNNQQYNQELLNLNHINQSAIREWYGIYGQTTPIKIPIGNDNKINLFNINGAMYQFQYILNYNQNNNNNNNNNQKNNDIFNNWKLITPNTKIIYVNELAKANQLLKQTSSIDKLESYDEQRSKIRMLLGITFNNEKRNKYQQYGLKRPKSLLLHGPISCGKRSLIKEIAKEFVDSHQLIILTTSDLTKYNSYEKGFLEKYNQSKQYKQSIFLMEQIEELFPNNNENESFGRDESLQSSHSLFSSMYELMNQLEKANNRNEIFIVGITNKIKNLNVSIRSLFDEEIKIDPPTLEKRNQIFHNHLGLFGVNYPKENQIIIDSINQDCSGFVGGDIALLVREAQINSLQRLGNIDVKDVIFKRSDFENKVGPPLKRDLTFTKFGTPVVSRVSWDDIGGLEQVKESLKEMVVWDYQHRDALKRLGVTTPRGVLLYGPPGTGKTLLSKAVAFEARANFMSINISEVVQGEMGESEKMLADLFRKAIQNSPTIIFIDEIQAIFGQRDASGTSGKNIISQLLIELDKVAELAEKDVARVMILAATNLPQAIDNSFLRPGRFDRQLYVGPPDATERLNILTKLAKKVKLSSNVDLTEIARITNNFTGSDLNGLLKKAGLNAIQHNINAMEITNEDIISVYLTTKPTITDSQIQLYTEWKSNHQ